MYWWEKNYVLNFLNIWRNGENGLLINGGSGEGLYTYTSYIGVTLGMSDYLVVITSVTCQISFVFFFSGIFLIYHFRIYSYFYLKNIYVWYQLTNGKVGD